MYGVLLYTTQSLFDCILQSFVCNVHQIKRHLNVCVCVLFHVKCHKSFPLRSISTLLFHRVFFLFLFHSNSFAHSLTGTLLVYTQTRILANVIVLSTSISLSCVCKNKLYISIFTFFFRGVGMFVWLDLACLENAFVHFNLCLSERVCAMCTVRSAIHLLS